MIKKNKKLFWKNNLLNENLTVIDAIKCINDNRLKIVLVINKRNKFIGTITDGDIRRALINKVDLDLPLKKIVKKNSFFVTNKISNEDISKILLKNKIQQIPVLNKRKKIIDVKYLENQKFKDYENSIVVMAGGKGTRLMPLTKKIPKPMLLIKDRPIIEHILLSAKDEGFNNFFFTVSYLSNHIKNFFKNGKNWQVKIKYLFEKKPLGTAGGLKYFQSIDKKPIIVCNGDIISNVRFAELLEFHIRNKAFVTVATKPHKTTNLYGVVKIKGKRIIGISEKPVNVSNINVGVYVFNPKAFSFIKKNENLAMDKLIERLIKASKQVFSYPVYESWLDIGRKIDFEKAKNQ